MSNIAMAHVWRAPYCRFCRCASFNTSDLIAIIMCAIQEGRPTPGKIDFK